MRNIMLMCVSSIFWEASMLIGMAMHFQGLWIALIVFITQCIGTVVVIYGETHKAKQETTGFAINDEGRIAFLRRRYGRKGIEGHQPSRESADAVEELADLAAEQARI